jgi:hypothetical protein
MRTMHRRHFAFRSGTGFPLTGVVEERGGEGGGSDAQICRVKIYFVIISDSRRRKNCKELWDNKSLILSVSFPRI